MRSLYINHEINCLLYDEHFIQTVKNKFHEDLENASLLSLKDVSRILSLIEAKNG